MNLTDLCSLFYSSHFLPIACYREGRMVAMYAPCSSEIGIFDMAMLALQRDERNPAVYSSPEAGLYGRVRVESSGEELVLGPVLDRLITEESVSGFLRGNAIPIQYKDEVRDMLHVLPQLTYNQFLNLLAFLHAVLNGKEVKLEELLQTNGKLAAQSNAERTRHKYASDEQAQHGTYLFETQMLALVRSGQTERLRDFLLESAKHQNLTEGSLADAPLRQAKNLFIGLVSMVGKEGAIPGGLDVEQTYRLIDLYTQECEKLQSIDAIKSMQFEMLLDFTERVGKSRVPEDVSPEIYTCVQYIRNRTNDRIGVDDVAACIGKSRSYTTRRFREEMHTSITQYIISCKLSDAQGLLLYTDRTLSEISNYLCFSSQAHFQSAFKKAFGTTPTKWRSAQRLEEIG